MHQIFEVKAIKGSGRKIWPFLFSSQTILEKYFMNLLTSKLNN
jgi:hypothetical protein